MRDPGLQPERTALAWRRSILAVLIADAVGLRLTYPSLGPLAVAIAVVAAAIALAVLLRAESRTLRETPDGRDGALPLIVALGATACVIGGIVLVASRILT